MFYDWTEEDERARDKWVANIKEQLNSRPELTWKFKDINIVSRKEWGAKKPKMTVPITAPITTFRHVFTGTDQCYTKEECFKVLRLLQKNHFKQGLPDLQYNFMIGGDGNVYEGAGWFCKVIDLTHYEVEADGGPRIMMGYIGRKEDISAEKMEEMSKVAFDLPNWGIENNMVMGGPLWRPSKDDPCPSPYDAGWMYNNLL